MIADALNRPLFKVLRALDVPEDDALDAAGGFVTSNQLDTLATKDDLSAAVAKLRSELTIRIVVFLGGGMLVLTQLLPPGKLLELLTKAIGG